MCFVAAEAMVGFAAVGDGVLCFVGAADCHCQFGFQFSEDYGAVRCDAADFVKKSGLGYICDPTNVGQIASTILTLLTKKKNNQLNVVPDIDYINRFERRVLTEELSEVFNYVLDHSN